MSKGSGGGGAGAAGGRSPAFAAGPITWTKSPQAVNAGDVAVRVSVAALDRGWRADVGYHLPRGSAGPFRGDRATMPRVSVDRSGTVSFTDGRHRFAAARDHGIRDVYVTVSRGQAQRVRRLFGT